MLLKVTTDKSVTETAVALDTAVKANHFGVMQVHNLQETMIKKGIEFARECLVFEVCQPQQAKKVLEQNMSVSTALPCRISIYKEGGKTILATLKPTTLLALFDTQKLAEVAREVEDSIVAIMKEAAGSIEIGDDQTVLVTTALPNHLISTEVGTLAGMEIGFRTDTACLKKRLMELTETLHSARQIGESEKLLDGPKVKWHKKWDTLERVLDRIIETITELDSSIDSANSVDLTTATSAWERFQNEDNALGEILAEIRAMMHEVSFEARTKWNSFAGPLETELLFIYNCAQSLRLKLECLKTHSGEEVDRFLDQIFPQPHISSANGDAEPYDHQYRRALLELGREKHEFRGLLDAVKSFFYWSESPSERVRKNRSLKVDEPEVVS